MKGIHLLLLATFSGQPQVVQEATFVEKSLASATHFQKAEALIEKQPAEALVHYLNGLEKFEHLNAPSKSDERELAVLMEEYLLGLGKQAEEESRAWIDRFENQELSKAQHLLKATAYLNLKDYPGFFKNFKEAYPVFHESYLSYRAKGILYLHVAALVQPQQKQYYVEKGVECLNHALLLCTRDFSVYELLVIFAKQEENDLLLTSTLETLVESASLIPRRCIYMLVREAIRLERVEIAQKIIDRAKELYEYCKATAAAQSYLKEYQKESEITAQNGELE